RDRLHDADCLGRGPIAPRALCAKSRLHICDDGEPRGEIGPKAQKGIFFGPPERPELVGDKICEHALGFRRAPAEFGPIEGIGPRSMWSACRALADEIQDRVAHPSHRRAKTRPIPRSDEILGKADVATPTTKRREGIDLTEDFWDPPAVQLLEKGNLEMTPLGKGDGLFLLKPNRLDAEIDEGFPPRIRDGRERSL